MKLKKLLLIAPLFPSVGFGLSAMERYGIEGVLAGASIGVGMTLLLLLFLVGRTCKG